MSRGTGLPGFDASTYIPAQLGLGYNKIDIETHKALTPFTPEVDAQTGWRDQFVISGGEGIGEATMRIRVHGDMSQEESSNLDFIVNMQDLLGLGGAALNQQLLRYTLSSEWAPGGEFEQTLEAGFQFHYGLPFAIEALLDIHAEYNGAARFGQTIELSQFVLPGGAELLSSGLEHGTVLSTGYGVTNVPAPSVLALLAPWVLLTLGQRGLKGNRSF